MNRFKADLEGLVLWTPVLDIEGPFLNPSVPWGIQNFTGDQLTTLQEEGHLSIDGQFKMGMCYTRSSISTTRGIRFCESSLPALVIHGDADDIVPYADARRVAEQNGADFHTISDAGHGFVTRDEQTPVVDDEREQDTRSVRWFLDQTDT